MTFHTTYARRSNNRQTTVSAEEFELASSKLEIALLRKELEKCEKQIKELEAGAERLKYALTGETPLEAS